MFNRAHKKEYKIVKQFLLLCASQWQNFGAKSILFSNNIAFIIYQNTETFSTTKSKPLF